MQFSRDPQALRRGSLQHTPRHVFLPSPPPPQMPLAYLLNVSLKPINRW